jgi:hypothetical protein
MAICLHEFHRRCEAPAWWWHKEGLDGRLAGEPASSVLEKTGWARLVGGAGPYLTLFSLAALRTVAHV